MNVLLEGCSRWRQLQRPKWRFVDVVREDMQMWFVFPFKILTSLFFQTINKKNVFVHFIS